jgi:YspA, cpYpsA-related SLOG family
MKILISGTRSLTDNNTYTELEKALNHLTPTIILHGGAEGVDKLAAQYATLKNLPQTIIKPDYNKGGKYAPLMRNTELVNQADKVICIYAADSIRKGGTGDTYKKAMKAGKLAAELIPEKGEVINHLTLF